jgi:hypothetical protein
MQQVIALFVLKTGAGFSIFSWIATLAADFLRQADAGSGFFFDAETIGKHWFFVNTVRFNRSHPLLWCRLTHCFDVARFYHLLHCIRADDVLPRCHAMGHQAIVSFPRPPRM